MASCRVRPAAAGFRKTGSPWIGRLKKGGFLGFVVAWKPPVGEFLVPRRRRPPGRLYGVAYYGNTNVEELQANELLNARLLLPQTPDEWQRDRAFAEFLRVRDVARECNDLRVRHDDPGLLRPRRYRGNVTRGRPRPALHRAEHARSLEGVLRRWYRAARRIDAGRWRRPRRGASENSRRRCAPSKSQTRRSRPRRRRWRAGSRETERCRRPGYDCHVPHGAEERTPGPRERGRRRARRVERTHEGRS